LGFWPSASLKHAHPPHCIPPSPPHTRRTVCHHHRPHEFHCWPQIVSDSVAKGAETTQHTTVISLVTCDTRPSTMATPDDGGGGDVDAPDPPAPVGHDHQVSRIPRHPPHHHLLPLPAPLTRFHSLSRSSKKNTTHSQRTHTLDSRLTALSHCRHQSRQTTAPQSHKTC
jgi:hypothetical protein